jgi:hypothetical protein
MIGRDGSTWIRLRSEIEGESNYLVLDSLGVPVGRVALPEEMRIASADLANIWAITTDTLGVQGIVKFAVAPTS